MLRLWTERDLHWHGQFRAPLAGITLQPRPVQQPHPPVYVSCSNLEAAIVPAKLGLNLVLTGLAFDLGQLKPMLSRLRQE